MPVSSPTEFLPASGTPPSRIVGGIAGAGATGVRLFLAGSAAGEYTQPVNDLVVIGDHALDAGSQVAPITDAGFTGSIIVGSQAATAATVASATGGTIYGSIVVGFNAAAAVTNITSCLVIGTNALKTYANTNVSNTAAFGSVVIGPGAVENLQFSGGITTRLQNNVVIGYQAAQGSAAPNNIGGLSQTVIIGSGACQTMGNAGGGGGGIASSVIIGQNAGLQIAQSSNVAALVIIGQSAGSGITSAGQNDVLIGQGITTANTALQNSTAIGQGAQVTSNASIVIGQGAVDGAMTAAQSGGIFIGQKAGVQGPVGGSDQFILENNYAGGNPHTLMVGNLANGTLVLGLSLQGTNRDQVGTSTVKIVNGVKGGANPIGGGYFYVTGGVLHWVDSAGTDTQVSTSAAGQLAANALVAYTNNAGAAGGTLTNAPAAGNPTKWIPINDNGTIRNIPAW